MNTFSEEPEIEARVWREATGRAVATAILRAAIGLAAWAAIFWLLRLLPWRAVRGRGETHVYWPAIAVFAAILALKTKHDLTRVSVYDKWIEVLPIKRRGDVCVMRLEDVASWTNDGWGRTGHKWGWAVRGGWLRSKTGVAVYIARGGVSNFEELNAYLTRLFPPPQTAREALETELKR